MVLMDVAIVDGVKAGLMTYRKVKTRSMKKEE